MEFSHEKEIEFCWRKWEKYTKYWEIHFHSCLIFMDEKRKWIGLSMLLNIIASISFFFFGEWVSLYSPSGHGEKEFNAHLIEKVSEGNRICFLKKGRIKTWESERERDKDGKKEKKFFNVVPHRLYLMTEMSIEWVCDHEKHFALIILRSLNLSTFSFKLEEIFIIFIIEGTLDRRWKKIIQ